jgi:uncharacterized membrane protein YcjF (UPF0283 family)
MLGTDLNQAYEQIPSSQNFNNGFQFHEESPEKIQTEHIVEEKISPNEHKPNNKPSQHVYDSTSMFKEIQMNDQIAKLQSQIRQQNNTQNNTQQNDVYQQDSVIDRYISKKKDVMKLIIMAFTVLLGLSLHYLITDLIRNYIASNDLTMNQEFITKFAYPVTIVLIIWTLKVFNR